MFITKMKTVMENQDKIYEQFKEASSKAEDKGFDRMEAVWNRVEEKLENKKQRNIATWWKYTGIAALFLLFMGIGTFMLKNETNPIVAPKIIQENNVTVIDTQKVKETFNPEIKGFKQEVVISEPTPRNKVEEAEEIVPTPPQFKKSIISAKLKQQAIIIEPASLLDSTITSPVADVTEQDDETIVQEVAVEAYRPTSRVMNNTEVTSFASKSMEGRPNANFIQTLQGQVPGLNITTGTETFNEEETNISPEEKLQADIKNGTIKLYVLSGMVSSAASADKGFQEKYKVKYHDFGCVIPEDIDYYKEYNLLVLDYLKNQFGTKWEKDIRKNVIGWTKWKTGR